MSTYPIPDVGFDPRDIKPDAYWEMVESFREGLSERILGLPIELRHRIYHYTVMGWDTDMPRMTRAQAVRRPIGLARRIRAPIFETGTQMPSLPDQYCDKNGLLDYFTPSEYSNLVHVAKTLFALECSSLDEVVALQCNNDFPRIENEPSLYVEFRDWFWTATILDLTIGSLRVGEPTQSLLWLQDHFEFYPQIQHISLGLNGGGAPFLSSNANVKDLISMCAFVTSHLTAIKTVILFVQNTFEQLMSVRCSRDRCKWVKAVRQLPVSLSLKVVLTVSEWPKGLTVRNKEYIAKRGETMLTNLMIPDSLRGPDFVTWVEPHLREGRKAQKGTKPGQ